VSREADQFRSQMRHSLDRTTTRASAIMVARHTSVYSAGDDGEMVYFIDHGQIKLTKPSSKGGECLLAVYTAGDVFGELSLSGAPSRLNTAMAMEATLLKQIPSYKFLDLLKADSTLREFISYLALRITDQQVAIANLVTAGCEQRLGQALLHLSRKHGQHGQRDQRRKTRGLRISQQELSRMVGTTRPRIGGFMQRFREMGLLEMSSGHYMIVKENKLAAYLASIT